MRRTLQMLVAGLLTLSATGCVAVSAKNNRWASDYDAVVLNGQIYIVNMRTGQVAVADAAKPVAIGALRDDCGRCDGCTRCD